MQENSQWLQVELPWNYMDSNSHRMEISSLLFQAYVFRLPKVKVRKRDSYWTLRGLGLQGISLPLQLQSQRRQKH